MEKIRKILLSLILLSLSSLAFFENAQAASTGNYYKCFDRVTGEWNFGRAPDGCNASAFGDDKFVYTDLSPVIFNDVISRAPERNRYMEELNAVIRDAAVYYIKKRKPQVGTAELSWWTLAIQATASNESYWSHYRKAADGKLKMMRGDFGHGHGLMQVDDRAHFPAVNNGIAWNLMSNLTYGMDIYYKAWEKAPSLSCVKSATNYEARVRSAWSAYNGGPSKACRWTNPNDKWARNDKNFYSALKRQGWKGYIANPDKISAVNVSCLMENRENCPPVGTNPELPPVDLKDGVLYQTANGKYCILKNALGFCVSEFRDAICLNSYHPFDPGKVVKVQDSEMAKYSPSIVDRHQVCKQYEGTLFSVGTTIETIKNINIRATPGGGQLGVINSGEKTEILDFELRNSPVNDRYYKIKYKKIEGYIFAGSKDDFSQWVIPFNGLPIHSSIAANGQVVSIRNASGINLRSSPGGTLLVNVPKNTNVTVLEVVTAGKDNGIYYKVSYRSQTGYIYTGLLLPTNTVPLWTVPVK